MSVWCAWLTVLAVSPWSQGCSLWTPVLYVVKQKTQNAVATAHVVGMLNNWWLKDD
jgi:hypothetical protein